MKNSLKKELISLLSNDKGKKYMLIASMKESGFYEVDGKKLNETEFAELQTQYENSIVWIHPDCHKIKS